MTAGRPIVALIRQWRAPGSCDDRWLGLRTDRGARVRPARSPSSGASMRSMSSSSPDHVHRGDPQPANQSGRAAGTRFSPHCDLGKNRPGLVALWGS
jgi:hypothetical protein